MLFVIYKEDSLDGFWYDIHVSMLRNVLREAHYCILCVVSGGKGRGVLEVFIVDVLVGGHC